jgi:hypothetical protein
MQSSNTVLKNYYLLCNMNNEANIECINPIINQVKNHNLKDDSLKTKEYNGKKVLMLNEQVIGGVSKESESKLDAIIRANKEKSKNSFYC